MSLLAGGDRPSELEDEEIHDILRNRRRRLVIDILDDQNDPLTVRTLSERIGAIESDRDPPPRNVKQSVYVSLLQTHLPKLDKLGIIDYDEDRKSVQVAESLAEVSVYLETVPKYGLSWSEFYTAVALLGLLSVLGAQLGTPLLSSMPPVVWAYGFFAILIVSSIYQTVTRGSSIVHRHLK